jgi:hypothetical protein
MVSELRVAGYKYPDRRQNIVGARRKSNHRTQQNSNTVWPILFLYVAPAAAMNNLCLLNPLVQVSAGSPISAL